MIISSPFQSSRDFLSFPLVFLKIIKILYKHIFSFSHYSFVAIHSNRTKIRISTCSYSQEDHGEREDHTLGPSFSSFSDSLQFLLLLFSPSPALCFNLYSIDKG